MSSDARPHEPSGWLHEEHVDVPEPTRDNVARRRRVLYDAMRDLEVAVSRPSSSPGWRQHLHDAVTHIQGALENHVQEVAGDGGLYEEILFREPRMAYAVDSLKAGLAKLTESCTKALKAIDTADSDEVRKRVNSVLLRLAQHRQKGAELIYDTYAVDIATGD